MVGFEVWEGYYRQILSDFGFSGIEDERSAHILSELLEDKNLTSGDELKAVISGRDVIVVGGGRNVENELDDLTSWEVLIAADGTTSALMERDMIPDIIVTDLDGKIEDQIRANEEGAIVAIHAHGDNIDQVKRWVARFQGKVLGTTQGSPLGILFNFGGFTDGDRAVFLAHHFGAGRIRLLGFDFEKVGEKPNTDKNTKLKKLQWAKMLVASLGIEVD